MMSLFAAFFGGWRMWLAIAAGAALITGILMVRSADRATGAAQERTRIERENRASEDAADRAARKVLDCPAGQWNREAGQCEK